MKELKKKYVMAFTLYDFCLGINPHVILVNMEVMKNFQLKQNYWFLRKKQSIYTF